MKRRNLFSLREINPIIRLFIISDFFLFSSTGLVAPIFALFITDFIDGATIETVGIASTIYFITRSVGQLPVGIVIDYIRGQRDDMIILIASSMGFIFVPIAYMYADTVLSLYLIQFFYGLLAAASYPTWYAIFTRSIDHGKEGLEWSVYQTLSDFGVAISAAIGSFVVAAYGFNVVFALMAVLATIGTFALMWSTPILFKR